MHTQYCVKDKNHDLTFYEHKLALETDEYGHIDRKLEYKQSRQLMIQENY